MAAARFCSLERRRRGIVAVRSPRFSLRRGPTAMAQVGTQRSGKIRALPGVVTQRCPFGEVQMMVPTASGLGYRFALGV
jgi:hypothetical protein